MAFIYKIDNNKTGKSYVGFTTKTPDIRFKEHLYNAKLGLNTHLCNAIRKDGIESFSVFTLLESSDIQNLLHNEEPKFIKMYDTFKNGYNMTIGGEGVMIGRTHTKDTKMKMSLVKIGKKKSDETRKKISKAKLGKKRPEISEIAKLNAMGNTHRAKTHIIIHPDGTEEIIFNLAKFCRIHNLSQGTITSRKYTKGFGLK